MKRPGGCDGVTWDRKKRDNCHLHSLHSVSAATKDKLKKDWSSDAFVFCKDCGAWEPHTTISGTDIKTITIKDHHWCVSRALLCHDRGTHSDLAWFCSEVAQILDFPLFDIQ